MVTEPQGALTCKSSTLAILANSNLSHGLLLTVLRSGAIFTIDNPRDAFMCRSSKLIVFPILFRFVDYYSPFWGPGAIFMVVEPQGALTCRSSTLAFFADTGTFPGLTHCFGVPERIPRLATPRVHLCVGHQHS